MHGASTGIAATLAAVAIAGASAPLRADGEAPRAVTALGRIEPGDGVVHVAGPSGAPPVIAELLVEEGDRVEKGQVLAKVTLDYQGLDVVSIITTRSAERLDLKTGDAVEALVKANEMTILHDADAE